METSTNYTAAIILDDGKQQMSRATSIICGSIILLISISGLIVYLLFIIIALGRKKFQRNSYFTMAGWLGIADCICLVLMIGYAAPCVILQRNLSDLKFIGGILNVGWFSGLPLIVFLAANRFFCICHTECFKTLFTSHKTRYYCLAALVFGMCYSLPSFMKYSPLFFDYHMMSWEWQTNHPVSKYVTFGEITIVMLVTLTTHTLNILVFKKIHQVHKKTSSQAIVQKRNAIRERKTFIQFFITTLWLPIFDISFISISYLNNPSPWLGYFVTLTYVLNCSVNGWVYLIMNHTIQRELREMFRFVSSQNHSKAESSNTEDADDVGANSISFIKSDNNESKVFISVHNELHLSALDMTKQELCSDLSDTLSTN